MSTVHWLMCNDGRSTIAIRTKALQLLCEFRSAGICQARRVAIVRRHVCGPRGPLSTPEQLGDNLKCQNGEPIQDRSRHATKHDRNGKEKREGERAVRVCNSTICVCSHDKLYTKLSAGQGEEAFS